MTTPRQLKALYEQGYNISTYLRKEMGTSGNTREIIEISYDLQTGSYIAALNKEDIAKHKENYTKELARTILSLCSPSSVLEAGVGEATTLAGMLKHMDSEVKSYGFDLSWSRVAFSKQWLDKNNISEYSLCTGDLFNIPFVDNSIDVVYTSHSIEPNGGNEEPILRELYRVARQFLVLLEPGYELAGAEARNRMDSHGYSKNICGIAKALGYKVLEHKLFGVIGNPLNPTAITIIEKSVNIDPIEQAFACPMYKTPLRLINDIFFSPEALAVYPVIGGIPCLRIENGIFASKYQEVAQTGR